MEAKDTVMSDEQIANVIQPYLTSYTRPDGIPMSGLEHSNYVRQQKREIAKAQALHTESLLKEQWIREGRKEVVIWVEKQATHRDSFTGYLFGYQEWQAQLEKWGIR